MNRQTKMLFGLWPGVALFTAVVLLASCGGSESSSTADIDTAAVSERTAPAGQVNVAEETAPANVEETIAEAETTPEDTPADTASTEEPAVDQADESPTDEIAAAETGASGDKGKEVYETACALCHGPGIAGAPKVGDKEAWAVRLEKGLETLQANAINGVSSDAGVMPPKGGQGLPDEDVNAAVTYMVENSR